MGESECVPEHNVCVGDVGGRVLGDPEREALRGFARCLGHVAACGVDLFVGI